MISVIYRYLIVGLCLVALLSISATTRAELIAEWHFDESAWSGSAGEVVDTQGNLSGLAVNGVTTTASGQVCRAASFDGVNDYLSISGIDTYLSTTSSLSFWMKTSQSGDNTNWRAPGITGVEQAGANDDIFWGYLLQNGRLGFGRGDTQHTISSSALNDDTWRHIVLTRDSPSGEIKMYINGSLHRTVSGITGDIGTGFSSLGRIEDTGGSPEYFAGELDEVLIFDNVISDAEVLSIYNNQVAGNSWDGAARNCGIAPIAEWRLDEDSWDGTADEVVDSSGNNYHGRVLYNVQVEDSDPAIATSGGAGTCNYGSFSSGTIAIDGLPVSTSTGDKTTVTFWMRWDGTNGSMPIGWSFYDLWFAGGSFGFNTWNNDIYGISSASLVGGWHHITAEFTNGRRAVTSNRLWVDGVEQSLSQRVGRTSSRTRTVGSSLRIGGAANTSFYRFHGDIDEVRVYDQELSTSQIASIMNETHPCGGSGEPNHFSISHDNNASYCLNESLVVSARDSSNELLGSYSGTITLDTQTGSGAWALASGAGSLVDSNSSDGVASYTFGESDNGVASFTLYYPSGAAVVDVDVFDGAIRDDDSEGNIVYASTGFSVTASPLANPVVSTNDPITSQTAGDDFQLAIAAYGIDPNNGECGIIETYTGNKSISLSTQYINPTTGTLAASGSGTVNFTQGQAVVTTRYDDVGSIILSVSDSSENIAGQSNAFVVKPDSFSLSVPSNPGTTNSGSGFIAAGEAFSVTVQALNSQGNLTPNYGNESTPESVAVALDSLVFPSGGDLGTLSNGSSFSKTASNEFQNTSLSWSEVGSIRLIASVRDGDYLGAGDVVSNASSTIGRFYPDSFFLGSASVNNSCSVFTYLSEPGLSLNYTLSAITSGGDTVTNYDAGLGYPVATIQYHAERDNNGTDLGTRLSTQTASWSAGDYQLSDTQAIFARSASREAPLNDVNIGLSVSGIDSRGLASTTMNATSSGDCTSDASCNAALLGSASFYFGRLVLPDAYGPETAALPAALATEYWDGTRFIRNVFDNCTLLGRDQVSFNTTPITTDAVLSINLATGITQASFDQLTASDIGFSSGDAGLSFSAPGVNISINSFTVDIDLTTMEWLRSDWDQDGDEADSAIPSATMSFRTYRGHDRVLYWRHRY